MRLLAITSALALGLFATQASAEEFYAADHDYDDDAVIVEDVPDHDYGPPPVHYTPPVYGWSYARPADCGVFRYWDGERCADARFEPPALD